MILFGVIGYIFRKLAFEPGPLLLAFVLGTISERSFRQSLLMSKGSPLIFFDRPVSAALMIVLLVLILTQIILALKRKSQNINQFRGAG
jgi:putative tricarboxylic transport membrane protein